MEMRALPAGVPIPAGKTVTFSPNGLHLMFMKLNGAFVKGKTVPVTLTFAKGRQGHDRADGRRHRRERPA